MADYDFTALPVTSSELDGADHPVFGHRRPAGFLDLFEGLRAQVRGELPETRPACPTVVTSTLARSTRDDAVLQETQRHADRLAPRGRAHWAGQLAEAELTGWHSPHTFSREAEGHHVDASLDFVVDSDGGSDLTLQDVTADRSALEALAYDELVSWLRLEAGLTDREVEALELRAAGLPVPDRHCLARAQRRAQAALS